MWQHPCRRDAQQDVAPAVQAWPHHVRDQPGNNYRSGLHPSDSPWHSSAVWTLCSAHDCQGLRWKYAFQISSWATRVKERRPDSGLGMCGEGELASLLATLEESCKQGLYHKDTLWLMSAEKTEQVVMGLLHCLDNWEEHRQNPFCLWGERFTFRKWKSFVSHELLVWIWRISANCDQLLFGLPVCFPASNYQENAAASMRHCWPS